MKSLYQNIAEIENGKQKAVLCTIIATSGSTPRKTGAKMLVYQNASISGTIGGGALEKKVIEQALECLKNNTTRLVKHNLVMQLDMCCGGSVELFLEPIMNRKKLYVFGAGHTGKALLKFASELDFSVTLIDERSEELEQTEADAYGKLVCQHHATAIEQLPFDENTFVVILTHDHAYDREILALTAAKEHAYIGMIGSQRKVELAKKMLLAANLISREKIAEVDMPIGIPIRVITPQEIAISILARLIDVRNKKQIT